MADNGRLRALANATKLNDFANAAASHGYGPEDKLKALVNYGELVRDKMPNAVGFSEGPVRVRNVPRQEMNNNQGRRQPQLTIIELKEHLNELYDVYNPLKQKCVAESARLLVDDPVIFNSVPNDGLIQYKNDLTQLIENEKTCIQILQSIVNLHRHYQITFKPILIEHYNALRDDINKNNEVLIYINSIINPMAGGKKKRKAKRKTKRRA